MVSEYVVHNSISRPNPVQRECPALAIENPPSFFSSPVLPDGNGAITFISLHTLSLMQSDEMSIWRNGHLTLVYC